MVAYSKIISEESKFAQMSMIRTKVEYNAREIEAGKEVNPSEMAQLLRNFASLGTFESISFTMDFSYVSFQ